MIQTIKNNFDVLDEEELKTLEYIRKEKQNLESIYISKLQAGRQGIFQRLFQALIREKIINEGSISWLEGDRTTLSVQLPSGKYLQAGVKRRHSLNRFDIEGNLMLCTEQSNEPLTHPVQLLQLFKEEGLLAEAKEEQVHRFKQEIQNGTANLTLALTGAAKRKAELTAASNSHTSLEWVIQQCKLDKNFSPLAFYEQCVVEGHPLHPGAKTKFGLNVEEVIQYSPEWGATPQVAFAAVRNDFCHTTSIDTCSVTGLLYQEYEGLQTVVEKILQNNGVNPEQYELIPVHPWQFDQTIGQLYKEEINEKIMIPISEARIPTQALVSFRSLAPVQNRGEKKHHIKTAINVQTTSAVRTVSPNSVVNGPILSLILAEVQERENHFGGSFIVLEEHAGIFFQPKGEDLTDNERWTCQANLASILRENPENHIKHEGEIPMASAALIADSPISGNPIVLELIEDLARHQNVSCLTEAAILFIQKYAQTSLPGLLTLMVRYGISLEGHMQNSVAIFYKGELVRLLIRDFGGIRVLPERLAKQGFQPNFYPGSAIVTEDIDQLRNIISYSVLQNHFAELITCIVRVLEIKEELLWKPIAGICKAVFEELKKDPFIAAQADADEQAVFQPMIDLKALTTMRLRGDSTCYPYIKVPNPLETGKGGDLK
nr:IucA/IucC family protein [Neobacillus sp. Marseille-Q6967]